MGEGNKTLHNAATSGSIFDSLWRQRLILCLLCTFTNVLGCTTSNHVSSELVGTCGLFITDGTDEGLDISMTPHVHAQVALLTEDFITEVTVEGFLTCVPPHVDCQLVLL